MSKNLREVLMNYHNNWILNEKVHVKARINGEIVFNGYYNLIATIETNYSRLNIDWPETGILPVEYQDHYGFSNNKYPVEFEYFEEEDIIHLSGDDFHDNPYKIVVQLPKKHSL